MKVSIVVLNYNGLEDTQECLNSLSRLNVPDGEQIEIIVVDNNSSDGSAEALSKLNTIELITSNKNLGYSGGNNLGIKRALERKSDFILLLNNDTIIDESMVTQLLDASKNADIIAPKIYFAKGSEFHKDRYEKDELGNVIWYAGGKIDWANIIGVHLGVDEVDHGQFDQQKQIDFATGACMLVKREVFKKIGLLNENYFLYLEDMDFCVRAKKAGFKIMYEPQAKLWHKNAHSAGGSGSSLQDYYFTRNRLLFALKYAKFKTKLAVFKHIATNLENENKKQAFWDFLLFRFGQKQ